MKSFKQHLNEELLNEIGDTAKGRRQLARYAGKAEADIRKTEKRADQMRVRAVKIKDSDPKRSKMLNAMAYDMLGTPRYKRRIRTIAKATSILNQAPREEDSELDQIYKDHLKD